MPSDEHYAALEQLLKAYDDLAVAFFFMPLQTVAAAKRGVLTAYLTLRELPSAAGILEHQAEDELEEAPL